ncbi:MAG: glycosyltransferase family 2 protein [Pseudomarimonas sp.]
MTTALDSADTTSGEAKSVSVIVVTHNSGKTLSRCLLAALAQDAVAALIVVDNGSSDHWRDVLPSDARLRRVENHDNPGFAVACNQGAVLAKTPWLLFLNPDCFLDQDSLRRLLDLAAGKFALAALGAELVDAAGQVDPASHRRAPTPKVVMRGRLAMTARAETSNSESAAEVRSVDAISGALMLVRREAFEQVGGFDPGYRLHCEDLDLCRRLKLAGFDVAIAQQVRVLHLKGTSSRARPVWVEWQKHRGMLRYFRKFDAATAPLWIRVAVPLGVALRFPIAALRACWQARSERFAAKT